ncbi:PAS domain S-box-containing protein [Metabacillus crassostreae]|uniref:GAF domain-containing protein n=1 Tax=Metabacillus crassostreae TaxID=929098 RepID=UPI00195D0961|nr:GAF domain-containing protein [Metabacillus crassostreae]MBM7604327.1 PAS domain S-box-containing protein [Metabacillus crassostreae]
MFKEYSSSFIEREKRRLKELYKLNLIYTPTEDSFDRITNLTSRLFQAPIALFTLITEEKQWFKSCVGISDDLKEERSTERSAAFCHYVVVDKEPLVVNDTLLDERFKNNRFVKEKGFRFYAGAPIITKNNNVLGSLCILDYKPRDISSEELAILIDLSKWIVTEIELRTDLMERTLNEKSISSLYEITSSNKYTFQEKLDQLLTLGCERFKLPNGLISRVDDNNYKVIKEKSKTGVSRYAGEIFALNEICAIKVVEELKPIHLKQDYLKKSNFVGIKEYVGAPIFVNKKLYGTFCFFTEEDVISKINTSDLEFIQLITQWVGNELERLQTEKNLKESQERFQQIANNINEAFWIYDLDEMRLLYSSKVMSEISGLRDEEFNSLHAWYDLIHPEDREYVQNQIKNLTNSIEYDFRIIKGDGQVRWIRSRIVPIYNEAGKKYRLVGVAEDITEAKLSRDLLRKSDKLAAVGQIAASIAHEVRNPLTSIKGFFQLLQENQMPYQELILSEFNQIEEFINEILILANSHIETKREKNKIHHLIMDVINLLRNSTEHLNIEFSLNGDENLQPINSNEQQIKQALQHVMSNAIEAMPAGGIVNIDFGLENSEYIYIIISDSGVGIPEDRIAKLGEPYYSNKEKGSGLGLMISYRIIQNHQGQIHFKSQLDIGTSVKILLPIS